METAISFDLNRAIENWRVKLAQSAAVVPDNLDELESHLRDSIAALQLRGLSEKEAWLVAHERMGEGAVLTAEYAKVNGLAVWADRILWLLLGVQLCLVLASAYSVLRTISSGIVSKAVEWNLGVTEPVYWILLILLPPAFAAIVIIVGWKLASNHSNRWSKILGTILSRPLKLSVILFLACSVAQVLASGINDVFYPLLFWSRMTDWIFWVSGLVSNLPQYLACAALICFFARKRQQLRIAR